MKMCDEGMGFSMWFSNVGYPATIKCTNRNNHKHVGNNCKLMELAFLVHFALGTSSLFAVGWELFQSFKIWRKTGIYKKSHKMLAMH